MDIDRISQRETRGELVTKLFREGKWRPRRSEIATGPHRRSGDERRRFLLREIEMQSRLERRMPGVAQQIQNSVANVLQEQTGWDFVQMGRMEGAADTFAALRLTGGRVRFFTSRADQRSEARTAPNADLRQWETPLC